MLARLRKTALCFTLLSLLATLGVGLTATGAGAASPLGRGRKALLGSEYVASYCHVRFWHLADFERRVVEIGGGSARSALQNNAARPFGKTA